MVQHPHMMFKQYDASAHGTISYNPATHEIIGKNTHFVTDVKHAGTWIRYVDVETSYHITYTIVKIVSDTVLKVGNARTSPPGINIGIKAGSSNYQLASRTILTITGTNFGIDKFQVDLSFRNDDHTVIVPSSDILDISSDHERIRFYQPIGYNDFNVYINVSGQASSVQGKTLFSYDLAAH